MSSNEIKKPLLAYTDADNVQQIVTASNVQRVKFNKNCVFETDVGEVFINTLKTDVDTINSKTNKMKKGDVVGNGDATEIEDDALFNKGIFYKQIPGDSGSTNIDLINQLEIQENYTAELQYFQNSTKYSQNIDISQGETISVSDSSSSIFNKAVKTVQFTAMNNTLSLFYTGIIYMNETNANVVSLNNSENNWTSVSVDMTGEQWTLELNFTNDTSSSMNVSFLQISS
jgi:hypothetical protein